MKWAFANHKEWADQWAKETPNIKSLPKRAKKEDGGTIPMAKSGIHIKPENKGKFTAYKKRTGKTTSEALHSKDPHVRQMANFARNAKKWKHDDGGVIPTKDTNPFFGTDLPLDAGDMQRMSYDPQAILPQDVAAPSALSVNPLWQGSKPTQKDKKDSTNPTPFAIGALAAIDASIPRGNTSRKYVRPEQQNSYNPSPYGTGSQAIAENGMTLPGFAGNMYGRTGSVAPKKGNKKMDAGGYIQAFAGDPRMQPQQIHIDPPTKKSISYTPDNGGDPKTWDAKAGYSGIQTDKGENLDPSSNEMFLNMIEYMKNNGPDSNIYRAKWQHMGAPNKKQYDQWVSKTGANAEFGGFFKKGQKVTIMSYEDGGPVQTFQGGSAPKISHNPIDGGMGEFRGKSHADGGIQSQFGGKPFEAEGGEPYRLNDEGDLEIFGALKNPLSGNTFKKDAKEIAKQEVKTQKYVNLGTDLINSTPESKNKFEMLRFNSGTAMLKGGVGKQKQLAQSKEQLSALQNLMLMHEGEQNKAAYGGVIPFFEKGGKMYQDGGVDPRDKFDKLRLSVIDELQKKYPGKSIKVEYNKAGKQRGLDEQAAISGKNKYSPEFGMHNLDAARDFNISIDGKPASTSVYKSVLHPLAKQQGLYNLSLANDPYHISLVQEGRGHSFSDLVKNNPGYLDLPGVKPIADQMAQRAILGNLSKKQLAAYKQLTGDTENYSTTPINQNDVKGALKIAPNERLRGENIFPVDNTSNVPLPVSLGGGFNNKLTPQQKEVASGQYPSPNSFNFTNPVDAKRNVNQSKFPWEQALPVIPALTDRVDPVQLQQFSPELYSPYSVSFQDMRNRNTADLNATRKAAAYDPSALSVLGAQAYQANEGINAQEFRTNQGIYNDVLNKNVDLLNKSKLQNSQLQDQQFTRQAQAIGNTRDRRTDAITQLADIQAKHAYENKALAVSQNLYKDYTYDDNGQLVYQGPSADQLINPFGSPNQVYNTTKTTKEGNTTTITKSQPLDYIDTRKVLHKKNGGKVTQSKLAKLMYS